MYELVGIARPRAAYIHCAGQPKTTTRSE